jgi:hypothetical protein
VFLAATSAAGLIAAAPAVASYGARSAPLLWEQQASSNGNDINVVQSAAILDASGTLTSCDNATGDQLCQFGRPTLSPRRRRPVRRQHRLRRRAERHAVRRLVTVSEELTAPEPGVS